jgi:hypothetical protein
MRELHPDDLTHLANLFHIHREASAHAGYLKPIADAAMVQLRDFAASLQEVEPEEAAKGDLDAGSTVEGEEEQRKEAVEGHFEASRRTP